MAEKNVVHIDMESESTLEAEARVKVDDPPLEISHAEAEMKIDQDVNEFLTIRSFTEAEAYFKRIPSLQ